MTNPQAVYQILNRPEVFTTLLIWTIVWKGVALWKSANSRQLPWFILILIINTLGLLEIAYIFYLNRYNLDGGRLLNWLESKLKRNKSQIDKNN